MDEEVVSTRVTVASDVKVQVEFNPARVAGYRIIGYENRGPAKEKLASHEVEAGDFGAGQSVTALCEIVPVGAKPERTGGEFQPPRYQSKAVVPRDLADELLTVKLRYRNSAGGASRRVDFPLVDRGGEFAEASADFRFAAAVAGFGMVLQHSPNRGDTTLRHVLAWPVGSAAGAVDDPGGHRGEFLELVRKAQRLME